MTPLSDLSNRGPTVDIVRLPSLAGRTLVAVASGCLVVTLLPPSASVAAAPLAGKVIGIDPGHNGRNWSNPSYLNRRVWNGRAWESCDTTGTQTTSGYTEAAFNYSVAQYLAADLRAAGAKVVWTRTTNSGVGPCVDRRAKLLNAGHADVSIDIHADGGPTGGRGFAILEPVADGPNNKVIRSSARFGSYVRSSFARITGMPISTYDGRNGIAHRRDLAGLNLTTEPKVLIECGNMRNSRDATLQKSKAWRQKAARALADAITRFLTR
jgi:N-acetylmuramoyl-L-alanine amidase